MDLDSDLLLSILFVGIIVNTAIIVGLAVAGRSRRRPVPSPARMSAVDQTLAMSYVDVTSRAAWPEVAAAMAEPAHDAASIGAGPEVVDDESAVAVSTAVADPTPVPTPIEEAEIVTPTGTDPLTGLRDAASFAMLVGLEDARVVRYHRPATIVVLELDGLDRLVDRLGPDARDRVVPALADTIRRLARGADIVARLGPGRFGVLLPETDEIAAINFVERVRKASELWLESGAMALRLAIGWAGTTGDPTLADAQRLAVERMYAELRRAARRDGADQAGVAGDEAVVEVTSVEEPADEMPPVELSAGPSSEPTRIAS